MRHSLRFTWLILVIALGGCGNGSESGTTEDRKAFADCPFSQQGQKYSVCGEVSIGAIHFEPGKSRLDSSVNVGTSDIAGQKFEVLGGTFHAAH